MEERSKKMGIVVLIVLTLAGTVSGAFTAFGQGETVILQVQGMVCPLCEQAVESVLGEVEGVISADASFTTGKARVKYEPEKVVPSRLVKAINSKTFYRAKLASADADRETEEVANEGKSIYAQILGVVKYGLWGLPVLLVGIVGWWVTWKRREA